MPTRRAPPPAAPPDPPADAPGVDEVPLPPLLLYPHRLRACVAPRPGGRLAEVLELRPRPVRPIA